MIDLVLNDRTGFAVVHDESDLDGATQMVVSDGACLFPLAADRVRRTNRVPVDLLEMLGMIDECRIIRMDGARVASDRTIRVR